MGRIAELPKFFQVTSGPKGYSVVYTHKGTQQQIMGPFDTRYGAEMATGYLESIGLDEEYHQKNGDFQALQEEFKATWKEYRHR